MLRWATCALLLLPIIVFCIALLYSSSKNAHPKKAVNSNKDHDWDLIVFTQEWPKTGCDEWKARRPLNKCSIPPVPNSWGIHGIWPSKYGTFGPSFCNRSAHFDPEAVKTIEADLNQVWTTYKNGTSNYSFWSYEWTKHGTCAAVIKDFNTQLKYLTRGIEFYKTYNLSKILSEANIVPTLEIGYDAMDIFNAIRSQLGVNPMVKCWQRNGSNYLYDIRICLNKRLKLYDCDGILGPGAGAGNTFTNCDRNKSVLYLPYNSSN